MTSVNVFKYLEESFGEVHVKSLMLMAEGDPFLPQAVREGVLDTLSTFKLEVLRDKKGNIVLPEHTKALLLEQYRKHASA